MIELNNEGIKYKGPGDQKSRWYPLESITECHLDPDIYRGVRI